MQIEGPCSKTKTQIQKNMRYLPKSPADREQMLREIGCKSIDDFFLPFRRNTAFTAI